MSAAGARSVAGLLGAAATVPAMAAAQGPAFVTLPSAQEQQMPRVPEPSEAAGTHALRATAGAASRGALQITAAPLALAGLGAALLVGRRARRSRVPGAPAATATVLRAFEDELGVQPPTGFWDPAGFCSNGDKSEFFRRRCVEIKHGRVSMIATIGYIIPEYFKFPGYISPSSGIKFADCGTGLAALSKVPALGFFQWVAFCGLMELFAMHQSPLDPPGKLSSRLAIALTDIQTDRISGWKWGPFGVVNAPPIADPEIRKKKLNSEIANGRLAMMAIIGMFFQDGLTGSAWGDWALYTDSPLRAYEDDTGVQAPVGFWDPLGLSASGSLSDYKRRREVELKHGRVAMFATIGYIVPEYTRLPGFLSPSYGIKFTEVPNGLGALTKVPALGWCQIVAFAGLIELNVYNENVNGEPGNYGAGFLGIQSIGIMSPGFKDPEVRKKKLNSELANGRLAMMAIIGMFFQDGLTGSAWGDWALYTDSPLRAFENEIGVQPPTGFWDPLGFTADGSKENFVRRRTVELKHGRVSMYACIGYIIPEYTRFSGELSPSMGIKFSDVPNGLAAFSKVPLAGWLQIVAFCGLIENTGFTFTQRKEIGWMKDASMAGEPGNYGLGFIGAFNLIKPVPALRTRKLNSELANGRLAMTAILAMFFQNGTFGTTGPEMWWFEFPEYAQTVGDFIPKNLA